MRFVWGRSRLPVSAAEWNPDPNPILTLILTLTLTLTPTPTPPLTLTTNPNQASAAEWGDMKFTIHTKHTSQPDGVYPVAHTCSLSLEPLHTSITH